GRATLDVEGGGGREHADHRPTPGAETPGRGTSQGMVSPYSRRGANSTSTSTDPFRPSTTLRMACGEPRPIRCPAYRAERHGVGRRHGTPDRMEDCAEHHGALEVRPQHPGRAGGGDPPVAPGPVHQSG